MSSEKRQCEDEAAVVALACGSTIKAAAARCGLSARTISRRLETDEFRQRIAEARQRMMNRAVGKLSRASSCAASTLKRLLKSDDEKIALGAARSILELAPRLRNEIELEQRISQLERRINEQRQNLAARPEIGNGHPINGNGRG